MATTKPVKRRQRTAELQRAVGLAAMTDGEYGFRVGRRVDTRALLRPDRVDFDVDRQVLKVDTAATLVTDLRRPPSFLLDRFIGLTDATDAEIYRFAQRFGVLSVDAFSDRGLYEESLDEWRRWARRVRAAVAIAACLHQEKDRRAEDWALLDSPTLEIWTEIFAKHTKLRSDQRQLYAERNALADFLNHFLVVARVRPCFIWEKTLTGIGFTNLGGVDEGEITLAGALALQLVLACSRAKAIATCDSCHRPYPRRWSPATKRRNFCKDCGIKAAWRESKRERRAALRGSK